MEPFKTVTGIVAPMDRANVDTDQIIPKQFLKRIERTGFGQFLFFDWRFLADGSPKPDFELNRETCAGATILLARRNFGCGSSREHAPWALADYGFKVLIAPSFADIFFNNCFNNGMLPIVLPTAVIETLFNEVRAQEGYALTVDLPSQTIAKPDGGVIPFDIQPFLKERLLNGWDQIGLTLRFEKEIAAYEARRGIA